MCNSIDVPANSGHRARTRTDAHAQEARAEFPHDDIYECVRFCTVQNTHLYEFCTIDLHQSPLVGYQVCQQKRTKPAAFFGEQCQDV